MDGNEKSRFDPQQQALFRQWITSPAAGYVRQNPDGTPYREPQPTLTDEEREAIAWFSIYSDTPGEERHAVVLAKLLQRTN